MGASLLAIAVIHSKQKLNVDPLSRASSLPQGPHPQVPYRIHTLNGRQPSIPSYPCASPYSNKRPRT
ncbi:Hypothetical protein PSEBR_m1599 [Pseudomonas brassicacearum subsp. brassicacearum NFM421]|uniref:Uncharacterized protein n=1 Tax=Pseudomonas brassicacearum (strain NFM421) TaxID=994484 RepID=F2KM32_PSEBN|nr:Hypothetical protein PSEBR_m1599 [Pseudomonas brassicacearum subsp. brassicacearum NFM421]